MKSNRFRAHTRLPSDLNGTHPSRSPRTHTTLQAGTRVPPPHFFLQLPSHFPVTMAHLEQLSVVLGVPVLALILQASTRILRSLSTPLQ